MSKHDIASRLKELTAPVRELIKASTFTDSISPVCLKDAVRAYPELGGKMMRPALVLGACGLFSESRMTSSVPVAAATEIFHDWTLVHDDIIDNDDSRRGKPSTHKMVEASVDTDPVTASKFGVDMAILAGDIQQEWSNMLILESEVSAEIRIAILKRLNGFVGPQLISGEAEDVEFELREFMDIPSDEMMGMLRKKTGLLLRFAAESGAMIGLAVDDHTHSDVKALGDFAETVGLAFQLRDDLLGMFADEQLLGKPVGSDLRQGKRTYLFAKALELLDEPGRDHLLAALGNQKVSASEAETIVTLLVSSGARDEVETQIQYYKTSAEALLRNYPESPYKSLLLQWAEFASNRAY